MPAYHIAQLNIGRLAYPLCAPEMAEFVRLLDDVNAVADADPDFVWRMLQSESDATPFQESPGDLVLVNLSVWRSLDALHRYVYAGEHREVMKRRRAWFIRMPGATNVLWWIPAGSRPTVHDAARRLALLRSRGATADAFTFQEPFASPPVAVARSAAQ